MLYSNCLLIIIFFFFFNDPATTEIYTLSLHDALPISSVSDVTLNGGVNMTFSGCALYDNSPLTSGNSALYMRDRKSTRLNSSHSQISYAVFCLKKKKK